MRIFENGLDALLDEIKHEASMLLAGYEIGSSDISCAVNNVLRNYYPNPSDASDSEFNTVRTGILNSIREDA